VATLLCCNISRTTTLLSYNIPYRYRHTLISETSIAYCAKPCLCIHAVKAMEHIAISAILFLSLLFAASITCQVYLGWLLLLWYNYNCRGHHLCPITYHTNYHLILLNCCHCYNVWRAWWALYIVWELCLLSEQKKRGHAADDDDDDYDVGLMTGLGVVGYMWACVWLFRPPIVFLLTHTHTRNRVNYPQHVPNTAGG